MERNKKVNMLVIGSFTLFGELDEDEISQYLLALDYGLTSTPWDLVGKSGTIAAMVEHGLGYCKHRGWHARCATDNSGPVQAAYC